MPARASVSEREPIDGHEPAESRQLDAQNRDLATLCTTRDALETVLGAEAGGTWSEGGRLVLSIGMSGDGEAAMRCVRERRLRESRDGNLRREAEEG